MKKVIIIGICEKFDDPKHNPEYYKKLSDRVNLSIIQALHLSGN